MRSCLSLVCLSMDVEESCGFVLRRVSAAAFFHAEGLIHRDLAARNVLVLDWDPTQPEQCCVKVSDYGLTREATCYYGETAALPMRWMPPGDKQHEIDQLDWQKLSMDVDGLRPGCFMHTASTSVEEFAGSYELVVLNLAFNVEGLYH